MVEFVSFFLDVSLLALGILMVFFNKTMYFLMVKTNTAFSKEFGKAVRHPLYRRFYRITIFVVGIFVLFISIQSLIKSFVL